MKNILVLNYEFPPLWWWASPVSYDISMWYIKLWYDVDVITMWYKDLPEYENINWLNVYRVKCLRTKKQVCHPREQLTYLYSWYKKAKELLNMKRYEICHTHFIIPSWVIAMRLKKKYWLDYIITAHWSDVLWHNPRFKLLYRLLKKPWKKIIDNSKMIISPSLYLKEKIDKLYWNNNKVIVIPNWIEINKFIPLKKEKYILTVSRLQKWKWIQDLLEAIKDVDLWDWKLKIVWEWPHKKELEYMVKEYNLSGKVQFIWWIDNKSIELKELFWKASIFCQPSYFENASIVLLEAMQSGCAILARSVWWNPETIPYNQLFNDVLDLKNRIIYFLKDECIIKNHWINNVNTIKNYEWDKIVLEYEKTLSIYIS